MFCLRYQQVVSELHISIDLKKGFEMFANLAVLVPGFVGSVRLLI